MKKTRFWLSSKTSSRVEVASGYSERRRKGRWGGTTKYLTISLLFSITIRRLFHISYGI